MPLVSVIIPNWNRADLLTLAIRSVQAQSFEDWELLVCDDGSTDESEKAVRSLSGDPRIRWAPGPRGGRPAIPRNRGLRLARGEWVAFLDNDDEWHPSKLAAQLARMNADATLASCTEALRLIPGQTDRPALVRYAGERLRFGDILDVNRVVCSSAMFHRKLAPVVEGFPEQPAMKAIEDYALWLRVASVTDFSFLPAPLVNYRDDAASSVRAEAVAEKIKRRRVFGDFLRWSARHPSAARAKQSVRAGVRWLRS